MHATCIIPPSVEIKTLSRYAGFSSDDPLCETAPSFYHVENLLTLTGDAEDEFRSLNVWLEATVSKKVYASLDPGSFFLLIFSHLVTLSAFFPIAGS